MTAPLERVFEPGVFIGLLVEKQVAPDFVQKEAAKNGLLEKPEFHISVLVARNAQLAWKAAAQRDDATELRDAIESLFRSYTWEYTLTHGYFLHERAYSKKDLIENGYGEDIPEHTRRSVVQKIALPELSLFYAKLNEMLKIVLPVPIPHITLFAWSDYEPFKTRGIGINSKEEFEQFTKQALVAH